MKQMIDQVNLSRLSHGFRAAGMMRRCLNEATRVARHRRTFGRTLIDHPLARRQLLKLMLPTEQALSVAVAAAVAMTNGDEAQLRILTPLVKYRACRDNVPVATGAMEMRGGNGYVEDWANAKLVRDAHLGLLWEGTSNVNALDIIRRAVGRERAHVAFADALHRQLDQAPIPDQFRGRVAALVDRAVRFADTVAKLPMRKLATAALQAHCTTPPAPRCWPPRAPNWAAAAATPGACCLPAWCSTSASATPIPSPCPTTAGRRPSLPSCWTTVLFRYRRSRRYWPPDFHCRGRQSPRVIYAQCAQTNR